MIRHLRRTHFALLVASASLAAAGSARAGGMATYQLVNTSTDGSAATSQVVASILPAGSVAPPTPDTSPLTILPGSTGFNASNLVDFLGDGTLSTGDPLQVLRLQFDPKGFGQGAVLNFGLNLAQNYTGPPPTLILPPGTTGLSLLPYTPPVATGGQSGSETTTNGSGTTAAPVSGGVTSASVPEPLSLALWSVAAGFGLLRARAFRRARQAVL